MCVLALAGVRASDIAADYELSEAVDAPELAAFLEARGTTAGAVIEDLLATHDVEAVLRGGGLDDAALAALRDRFVELLAIEHPRSTTAAWPVARGW